MLGLRDGCLSGSGINVVSGRRGLGRTFGWIPCQFEVPLLLRDSGLRESSGTPVRDPEDFRETFASNIPHLHSTMDSHDFFLSDIVEIKCSKSGDSAYANVWLPGGASDAVLEITSAANPNLGLVQRS